MQVRILAYDPGTASTGFGFLTGDTMTNTVSIADFGVIRTKKVEGGSSEVRDRIDAIGAQFRRQVEVHQPTHVAVEDFTEQGKFVGKTYKEMAWLTEHFRLVGRELGLDVAVYENGYWKKELTGAMRLNKTQVQHYVAHRIPQAKAMLARQPDHVWDACGIGLCRFKSLLNR